MSWGRWPGGQGTESYSETRDTVRIWRGSSDCEGKQCSAGLFTTDIDRIMFSFESVFNGGSRVLTLHELQWPGEGGGQESEMCCG